MEYLDCFSANFFDDILEYGLFNDPIDSELTFSLLLVKLGLTKSKTPQIHLFFSILSRFQSPQGRFWYEFVIYVKFEHSEGVSSFISW